MEDCSSVGMLTDIWISGKTWIIYYLDRSGYQNICLTSIPKILVAGLDYATVTGYLILHYEFIDLFYLSHFSKIIKPEMKPYLYPDIYPDNLISGKWISG